MMSLHRLPETFGRRLSGIIDGGLLNAGDVILRWDTSVAPADQNVEEQYLPPVPATETLGALIHWVSTRTIERGFTDFKAGDAIITFDPVVDLERPGLTFELPDGNVYVQAAAGKQIMEFWDVVIGGVPSTKTLLLRLKPTTP